MSHKYTVGALAVYPVKSCAPIVPLSWAVGSHGFLHDREWMVVDENGTFITQRTARALAVVQPMITADGLHLTAPGMDPLLVGPNVYGSIPITVWSASLPALDCGDDAASWFSRLLQRTCRLVRFDPQQERSINPMYRGDSIGTVGFADGYPFHIASEASRIDLERRAGVGVPMARFRPNIVVEGGTAYDEEQWHRIRIGDVVIALTKPTVRCVITTIDATTLTSSREPLATLATYKRNDANGVTFGMYAAHHNTGVVHVGDEVHVEELQSLNGEDA